MNTLARIRKISCSKRHKFARWRKFSRALKRIPKHPTGDRKYVAGARKLGYQLQKNLTNVRKISEL